jgi:hypothetical protein
MLQAIHQKAAAPRASSVYCRWIRNGREKGAPLVAVWIDSQMGCFEAEFAADPDTVTHDSVDEPGGQCVYNRKDGPASAISQRTHEA